MIFDILEAKLEAAGFVPGETLWRNTMPAEVARAVMLRAPLSGVPVDPEIPGWHKSDLQAVVRHEDPVLGADMAALVMRTLTLARESFPESAERGPAHISSMVPKTLPIFFPRLEGGGYEWSITFKAAFGFTARI